MKGLLEIIKYAYQSANRDLKICSYCDSMSHGDNEELMNLFKKYNVPNVEILECEVTYCDSKMNGPTKTPMYYCADCASDKFYVTVDSVILCKDCAISCTKTDMIFGQNGYSEELSSDEYSRSYPNVRFLNILEPI